MHWYDHLIHLLLPLHLPPLSHLLPGFLFPFFFFKRRPRQLWTALIHTCKEYLLSTAAATSSTGGAAKASFSFSIRRRRAFSIFSVLEKLERKNLDRSILQLRSKGPLLLPGVKSCCQWILFQSFKIAHPPFNAGQKILLESFDP